MAVCEMTEAVMARLEAGEQSLLFLNCRGYADDSCSDCGPADLSSM